MDEGPQVDARRIALDAVLDSGVLGDQSRLRQLLTYLVEQEIAGQGERLKAYNIATEALGRGPGFNPSTDSIVRVEVARLRQALALYAASAPEDVALVIDIPKGVYRPEFLENPAHAEPDDALPPPEAPERTTASPRWRRGLPVVLVAALVCLAAVTGAMVAGRTGLFTGGADPRPDRLRIELRPAADTPEVTEALLDTQRVLSSFSQIRTVTRSLNDPEVPTRWPETYRLTVAPVEGGGVRLDLVQAESGDVLSSQRFDTSAGAGQSRDPMLQLSPLQAHVSALVQREGEIEADYRSRGEMLPALRCMMLVNDYFPHQTDAGHKAATECIEAELARGERADLYVGLAYMFREEYTDRRNPRDGDPLARALAAANRAAQLDPYGGINYYAQATVLNVMRQRDAFLRAARTAIQLNPYNPEIAGGIGARFAQLGHAVEALIYLRRAEDVKPNEANWRNYAFFLAHFDLGETRQAVGRADLLIGSDEPLYLAARVIAREISGDTAGARTAYATLLAATGNAPDMAGEYGRRNYAPHLAQKLLEALATVAEAQ